MEYVTFTLAVILFGVFLYATGGGWITAGRAGGPLLLRVAPARPIARIIAATAGALLTGLWAQMQAATIESGAPPWVFLMLAFNLFLAPWIAMTLVRSVSLPLEIRERGLLLSFGGIAGFRPWRRIKYCKWTNPSGTLLVQCFDRNHDVHVPPGQVDDVTAALVGRVELRDPDGRSIAPRPPAQLTEASDLWVRPRLQFQLRALLLLAVVLAAASGWLAMVVHRLEARHAAVASLESFQPYTEFEGSDLVRISFGTSATLGDDDLAPLARCKHLRTLDLSFSQVTDAGLVHLEGLTNLKTLNLFRTQATPAGIRRLEKALPNTQILH